MDRFFYFVLEQFDNDEGFVKKLVYSNETTFYLSENVRIRSLENSPVIQKHERDSPNVNLYYLKHQDVWLFFFCW